MKQRTEITYNLFENRVEIAFPLCVLHGDIFK